MKKLKALLRKFRGMQTSEEACIEIINLSARLTNSDLRSMQDYLKAVLEFNERNPPE